MTTKNNTFNSAAAGDGRSKVRVRELLGSAVFNVATPSLVRTTNIAYLCLVMAAVGPVACSSPPPADPPPPPEVAVITLATEPVTMTAELPGRTVAVMVSEVRPQIRGLIQRRLFTEGQQVTAGQVLYQIDPALYQADYDSAKATLARVEAALVSARLLAERYAELVKMQHLMPAAEAT